MTEPQTVPAPSSFAGWPPLLRELCARRSLSRAQARDAMAVVLQGEATPSQIAGFAVALRMKGESVEELAGLLDAMVAAAEQVSLADPAAALDTCGTGGDGSHTINVSTLAALVIAGAGGKVCKHGNRAASSACGSADLLEAFGVHIEAGPSVVARCVEEAGIGFCFAPRFHPAMRHAGPTRRELGVPTAFNFLGPIANPARVGRQVVGVSDPTMAERLVAVLQANGTNRAMVVYGHDGLDELSTVAPSTVIELRDGETTTSTVDAAALGLAPAQPGDLRGGNAAANVAFSRAVLAGEAGPHHDIVVLNAAAGLVVAGLVATLGEGVELAHDTLVAGRAAQALERLVALSHEPG